MTEKYLVGSGKLYLVEVTATNGVYTIPAADEIEIRANRIGVISGGASVEYTPTFGDVKDDLGEINDNYLQEEDVVFKSGILTWDVDALEKLSSTGQVVTTELGKMIKIGGLDNYNDTKYVIRFVHEDKKNGDLAVTIVGSNTTGFEISFAKDSPTTINAEFKAVAGAGSAGVLLQIEERDLVQKSWAAVDDTQEGYSEMNPHALGWATRHGEVGSYEYWPTDDESPEDEVTYYEYV